MITIIPIINLTMISNKVEDYIAPRFSHKRKSKLRQKILEAHANVKVKDNYQCMYYTSEVLFIIHP